MVGVGHSCGLGGVLRGSTGFVLRCPLSGKLQCGAEKLTLPGWEMQGVG